MENTEQNKLKFRGVSILGVNFLVFKPFAKKGKVEMKIDAKLVPVVEGSLEFQIWMEIEVKVQECWEIKVSGIGSFEIQSEVTDPRPFINVNAPAIMFPYFRSFISTLTANAGGSVPPIILPPRFFHGELKELTD